MRYKILSILLLSTLLININAAEKRPAELQVDYKTLPDLRSDEMKVKMSQWLKTPAKKYPFAGAEIRWDKDSPYIFSQGRELRPVIRYVTANQKSLPVSRQLSEIGVEIFDFGMDVGGNVDRAYNAFMKNAEMLHKINPEAKMMLHFWIPTAWLQDFEKKYPGAFLTDINGGTGLKVPGYPHPKWPNYLYEWQEYIGGCIYKLLERIGSSQYANKVIGVDIGAMYTGEWWYPKNYKFLWDYSKGREAVFKKYIETKYAGNLDYIRKLWNVKDDKDLFRLPTRAERRVFPPVADSRNTNYLEILNIPITNAGLYFAEIIKKVSHGQLLVGLEMHLYLHILNCNGTVFHRPVLESPYVDFFNAPSEYETRRLGHYAPARAITASMIKNRKLFIHEEDFRTHRAFGTVGGIRGCPQPTPELSRQNLRRQLTSAFMHGRLFYFMDFGIQWFMDPDTQKEIARASRMYKVMRKAGLRRNTKIAFVSDQESQLFYNYFATPVLMYESYMPFIGADFDFYELSDFLEGSTADKYKVVVFGSIRALREAERKGIDKLKKDGRTLIFLHDPGVENLSYINADTSADLTALTGIKLQYKPGVSTTPVLLEKNTIKKELDFTPETDKYGKSSLIPPSHLSVCDMLTNAYSGNICANIKSVDPTAQILGKNKKGEAVFVIKKNKNWTSIYSASCMLTSEIMRAILRKNDCHVYSNTDDVIFSAGDFVMLHTKTPGNKILNFPSNSDVLEIYSNKVYKLKDKKLTCNAKFGETFLFYQGNISEMQTMLKDAEEKQIAQNKAFVKKYPAQNADSGIFNWLKVKRPSKRTEFGIPNFSPSVLLVSGPYETADMDKISRTLPLMARPAADAALPEYDRREGQTFARLKKRIPSKKTADVFQAFTSSNWNYLDQYGIGKGQGGFIGFYLVAAPGKEVEIYFADENNGTATIDGIPLDKAGRKGLFGTIVKLKKRYTPVLIRTFNKNGTDGFTIKIANVVQKMTKGDAPGRKYLLKDVKVSLFPENYDAAKADRMFREFELKNSEVIFHYKADGKKSAPKLNGKFEVTPEGLKVKGSSALFTDKWFNIDPEAEYVIYYKAKRAGQKPLALLGGFMIWGTSIQEVNPRKDTFTELLIKAEKGTKKITVRDASKWKKGAHFAAFNAKSDFSDLPNKKLVAGISEIKKDGDKWIITLKNPLNQTFAAGTFVREHSPSSTYNFTSAIWTDKADWKETRSATSGIASKGVEKYKFWPGAKKARPVIIPVGSPANEVIINEIYLLKKGGRK